MTDVQQMNPGPCWLYDVNRAVSVRITGNSASSWNCSNIVLGEIVFLLSETKKGGLVVPKGKILEKKKKNHKLEKCKKSLKNPKMIKSIGDQSLLRIFLFQQITIKGV